jgi:type I restriction enzyme S subunit
LIDILTLQRGFDLPKGQRTPGKFPLITAGGVADTHCESKVDGPGVVTGRSGQLGIVTFVSESFWPLNTTLWVKEYSHSNPFHAYFLLKLLDFSRFNAGSAVPTLNRNHVHGLELPVPDKRIIDSFARFSSPFFQKMQSNDLESRTLAQTRDLLLPKLMSGEIRVKDAEKAVGQAL